MLPEAAIIDHAVVLLQAGELVAFPTETVYGLGADAANPSAVRRIFAAKGRPADHPLIVHLPADGYLDNWASDIPRQAWELTEAFWPGPLTLILKRARGVPSAVTGGQETIGLRVPAHPLALALLRAYAQAAGDPSRLRGIAAPSANRFGRISPTEAAHVREELGDSIKLILDGGRCPVGIESTIVDLTGDAQRPARILRPGRITAEQIELVSGLRIDTAGSSPAAASPRVPGSLAEHYAPATPLLLVPSERLADVLGKLREQGRRYALLTHATATVTPLAPHAALTLPARPKAYARSLYAALRRLDQAAAEVIVVEAVATDREWAAIADRLQRAAGAA